MNSDLENRFSRALTLESYMNKPANKALWVNKPLISGSMGIISGLIASVKTKEAVQVQDIKGFAETKKESKAKLVEYTEKMQDGLKPYARSIHDEVLYKKIGFAPSKMKYCADTVTYELCKGIYDFAVTATVKPILKQDFEITDMDFTNLDTYLTKYETFLPAPREAISEHAAGTKSVEEDIDAIDKEIRDNLKVQMLIFRKTQTTFYDGFKSTTKVIDLGSRKKKGTIIIKGKVIHFETEGPLGGVLVWVQGFPGIKAVSKADGTFELVLVDAGTYVILAEGDGYYQYDESMDVVKNMTYEIVIDLEPKVTEGEPPVEGAPTT